MKKNIKILSIFLFILNFSFAFILISAESIHVKADVDLITSTESYKPTFGENTTITPGGTITIPYEYGISEVLLYVEKCTDYDKKIESCKGSFEPAAIIHRTGRTATNAWLEPLNSGGSKSTLLNQPSISISLSTYVDVGDVVRISAIYELADYRWLDSLIEQKNGKWVAKKMGDIRSGFFFPQFCNVNAGMTNCNSTRSVKPLSKLLKNTRVEKFISDNGLTNKNIQVVYDSGNIIYVGNHESLSNEFPEGAVSTRYGFQNIVLKVANEGDNSGVNDLVNGTIIPALLAVLGVAAVVTSTVLGYKIIKAADDPGERQEKIKYLRNILIGLAVAAIVLLAANPIREFIEDKLLNKK